MSVKYVVLNEGSLVLELWLGIVTHDEVRAHERQHLSDVSIARGASVLVDATGATFETEREAGHEVTDRYRHSVEKLRVGKCALLVKASAYDRARVYEKYATDLGLRVILFNALNVACAWLGVTATVVCEEFEKLRSCIGEVGAISQPRSSME
jgi:hypothetical protein